MFNPQLYLLAYGRIYANKGAMTPGVDGETADGMSTGKIRSIIDALRHERYRFQPVRRTYIPKKNGKMRPLGGCDSFRVSLRCDHAARAGAIDAVLAG
jgi:retron-type reverse transcriptase